MVWDQELWASKIRGSVLLRLLSFQMAFLSFRVTRKLNRLRGASTLGPFSWDLLGLRAVDQVSICIARATRLAVESTLSMTALHFLSRQTNVAALTAPGPHCLYPRRRWCATRRCSGTTLCVLARSRHLDQLQKHSCIPKERFFGLLPLFRRDEPLQP